MLFLSEHYIVVKFFFFMIVICIKNREIIVGILFLVVLWIELYFSV